MTVNPITFALQTLISSLNCQLCEVIRVHSPVQCLVKEYNYCLCLVLTSLNTGTRPGPAVARHHVCVCITERRILNLFLHSSFPWTCNNVAVRHYIRSVTHPPDCPVSNSSSDTKNCFVGALTDSLTHAQQYSQQYNNCILLLSVFPSRKTGKIYFPPVH